MKKNNLIKREEKIKANTRFNPNTFVASDSNKQNSENDLRKKATSLRCSVDLKNKVNSIVSSNNFSNIEEALQEIIRVYETTMSQEKLKEYEIIKKILDRKQK